VAEIQANTKLQDTRIREDHADLRNATTHLRAIREQDKNVAKEVAIAGAQHRHEAKLKEIDVGSRATPMSAAKAA